MLRIFTFVNRKYTVFSIILHFLFLNKMDSDAHILHIFGYIQAINVQ